MNVIFEVDRKNTRLAEEIKRSSGEIIETYNANGLNGTEIVAIVIAFVPAMKEIVMKYLSHPNVVIKLSDEFGSIEISTTSIKKAERQLEAALKLRQKNPSVSISIHDH